MLNKLFHLRDWEISENDAEMRWGDCPQHAILKPAGLRRWCLGHAPAPPWCDPTG
jgi:hypothetical protein